MNKVLIDSSFFIALVNQKDQYHDIALNLSAKYNNCHKFISDAIILELSNALVKRFKNESIELIETIRNSEDVTVIGLDAAYFTEAFTLYKKFPDKSWSLTDCFSFVIMSKNRIKDVLTFDKHFEQAGFNALIKEN